MSENQQEKLPRFLVSYDLIDANWAGRKPEALYAALEAIGAKRIQENVWVVRTSESVRALSLHLQNYISATDRILVTHTTEFTSHNGLFDFRLL